MKRSISTKIIKMASKHITRSNYPPVNIIKRNYLHPHIFGKNYVEYKVPLNQHSNEFISKK